jgi:hypothetical protein
VTTQDLVGNLVIGHVELGNMKLYTLFKTLIKEDSEYIDFSGDFKDKSPKGYDLLNYDPKEALALVEKEDDGQLFLINTDAIDDDYYLDAFTRTIDFDDDGNWTTVNIPKNELKMAADSILLFAKHNHVISRLVTQDFEDFESGQYPILKISEKNYHKILKKYKEKFLMY